MVELTGSVLNRLLECLQLVDRAERIAWLHNLTVHRLLVIVPSRCQHGLQLMLELCRQVKINRSPVLFK